MYSIPYLQMIFRTVYGIENKQIAKNSPRIQMIIQRICKDAGINRDDLFRNGVNGATHLPHIVKVRREIAKTLYLRTDLSITAIGDLIGLRGSGTRVGRGSLKVW